MTIERDMAATW